jgi:hypothetical protein
MRYDGDAPGDLHDVDDAFDLLGLGGVEGMNSGAELIGGLTTAVSMPGRRTSMANNKSFGSVARRD